MVTDEGHAELLRGLASKLRRRNLEQTAAFKDAFIAHQGLLNLNEKLRQQTLDQDKVGRRDSNITCASEVLLQLPF